MQKKFKKWQFQKKFILLETTLKVLKYVPNTICIVSYKFQAYISQKKKSTISQKIFDPGYAKKFKNWQSFKKKLFCSKQPKKS